MKKFLAVLLTVAVTFALAACGGGGETATTTAFDLFGEDETGTIATETATVSIETTTAEPYFTVDAAGETTTAAEETTTAAGETTTAAVKTTTTTKAPSNGLNSTNIAEVVKYYNAAVKKTKAHKPVPKGHKTMKLVKGPNGEDEISGDGAIGAILKVLKPAAVKALAKNSTETDWIPGEGKIKTSDVTKAKASSKNGVTTISLAIKKQVDGADADSKEGSVGRSIGTLGSIDGALKELGATLIKGRETVSLTYDDAYIKCTIDEKTGLITGGKWHYVVHTFIKDGKAKLGIPANLKNLKANIGYEVII